MLQDKPIKSCFSPFDSGAYSRLQFRLVVSHCMGAHTEAFRQTDLMTAAVATAARTRRLLHCTYFVCVYGSVQYFWSHCPVLLYFHFKLFIIGQIKMDGWMDGGSGGSMLGPGGTGPQNLAQPPVFRVITVHKLYISCLILDNGTQ